MAELLTSPGDAQADLLQRIRSAWPLNGKAASLERDDQLSDRVRLRRVISILDGWGISASGIEPSQVLSTAQVYFGGSFSTSGALKERTLSVSVEDRDIMEQVQVALQSVGWPAVVSRADQLIAPRDPVTEDEVCWLELDFRSPVGDLSPARAASWIEHCPGIDSPRSLENAEASGLSPSDLAPWAALCDEHGEAYIRAKPSAVKAWIEAGWTPEMAEPWFEADRHLLDFNLTQEWIAAGCGPLEARAWINLLTWGADPQKISEWTDKGFTDKHAVRILRAGGGSWSVRSLVDHSGATPAEAVAWMECGVTNYSVAERWLDIGLGGHELRRWNRAAHKGGLDGFLSRDQVSVWLEAGRSFSEAEPWLELSWLFIELDLVSSWEQEGLGPQDAAQWAKSGVPSLHDVKAWQAVSPRCSDPQLVGGLVDKGVTPDQAALVLDRLS